MDELALRALSVTFPEHQPRGTVLVGGEENGGRIALVETVEERDAEMPRHLHN